MSEIHKALHVLGLEPGASQEAIQRRYKRLIMVWHPDRFPNDEGKKDAEEELKKINNANDILKKHFATNHRASGCECQKPAPAAGGAEHHRHGPGPGPGAQRTRSHEDKQQEEEAARKSDAERKAREQQEANARRAQEEYRKQSTQQTMENAMEQQKRLADEKLRWQISIGLILAFIALEIFGSAAIGLKSWWHDFTWKWQNEHSSSSKPPDTNSGSGTSTGTSTDTYIPPYYRTPGGNQETWQQEQAQRDKDQKEREQKQHDQDIYFAKLEIDKYEKVIEHCNSELTNLELKLVDPSISEYEKNKLREMRDFRQKNLAEAQENLKYARKKLADLTGQPLPETTPTVISPFNTSRPGIPLVPIPSNSSPFAPPADPNASPGTSLGKSFFDKKYGLGSSSSSSSLSELMKKYATSPQTTPSTTPGSSTPLTGKSFFDKKYDSLSPLSTPSSSTSRLSDLLKQYESGKQTIPVQTSPNPQN